MTYKQAKNIDIFLKAIIDFDKKSIFGTVNLPDFKKQNTELDEISLTDLKKLIAIIRFEQIKLGIIFITGDENSFKPNKEQIDDLLLSGGFKRLWRKKLTDIIFVYLIPLITLLILIWSVFIKESDLLTKKSPESNNIHQQLIKEEKLPTKKLDSSIQVQSENHEHTPESIESDSLK